MAISLSELTGASTSGNVLNEVNSYADFLDSVPRLVNKADPSGNTDAVQTVATKQPIALPLIDGEGYLYCSGVADNHAYLPALGYDSTDDHSYYARCYISSNSNKFYILSTRANTIGGLSAWIDKPVGGSFTSFNIIVGTSTQYSVSASLIPLDTEFDYLITYNGSTNNVSVYIDGVAIVDDVTISTTSWNSTTPLFIGARGNSTSNYAESTLNSLSYFKEVKVFPSVVTPSTVATATPDAHVDFTSPRIPHGATEFECETGQVVTVNTSGNNPAKVIKKPVLRFPNASDGSTAINFQGLLNQTVTGGYFFAAFSLLGDGGEANGRIFGLNTTEASDNNAGGWFVARSGSGTDIMSRYNGDSAGNIVIHEDVFDDAVGDILLEHHLQNGSQISKINNANEDNGTTTSTGDLSSEEFSIAVYTGGWANTSIDLEYLALFPATLSDAQADQVRNFINNRNKVFYRWDTDGYYFFDGAATDDGQVFTGSGSWNGRIVGSDNGDSDFYANENTTSENRPTTDGYKVTFADNSDKLDIPQVTLENGHTHAWQVVGTSLGTFAYKVTVSGQTELNLLGHLGSTSHRRAGDLYGIILLPESATNRDIEEARKLLIDRGAADGMTVTNLYAYWYLRQDMAEFGFVDSSSVIDFTSAWNSCSSLTSFPLLDTSSGTSFTYSWSGCSSLKSFPAIDTSSGTSFYSTWRTCSSLTSFPLLDTSSGTDFGYTWSGCTSLESFPAIDMSSANNFTSAWQNCTSLQSFPENALLGTEVTGSVDFTNAWRLSGLTSFSTPLPTATSLSDTWRECQSLVSFNVELPSATNVYRSWRFCYALTDFYTSLPLATSVGYAWQSCSSLTSFSTPLPKITVARYAWTGCSSLTDFSADVLNDWNPPSLSNDIFNETWTGCTSLTAQSVENILVPISASGKWATNDGTSGGTALADATIDIDYNVATGSLTAATLTAIETLNGRGWSANINGVIQ